MSIEKDWILNLGRSPTMEELREYFHENDFSAAKIMEFDYETLPAETVEMLEEIKQLMNKPWEEYAQEMGMRSSDHYGKEHPLIALRDNTENLVSSTVFKLLDENPESVEQILDQFDFADPEIHQKADSFLNTAVKTTMQVMDYEKLAQVIRELPTYEDFNHNKHFNQPEIDFHRKWYHTRTKTQVVSLDAMQETADEEGEPVETPLPDKNVDVEEEVISQLKVRAFWASLNDAEQALLNFKMQGLTTQDIAAELGLKTHSAVVKRLQKIRKKFDEL